MEFHGVVPNLHTNELIICAAGVLHPCLIACEDIFVLRSQLESLKMALYGSLL